MLKTLCSTALLIMTMVTAQAQETTVTLDSALSMSTPRIPSLLANDPTVLKTTGIKGPLISVQPATEEELRAAELKKQQVRQKYAVALKVSKPDSKNKPVEAGRYTSNSVNQVEQEVTEVSKEAPKLPIANGQYVVE